MRGSGPPMTVLHRRLPFYGGKIQPTLLRRSKSHCSIQCHHSIPVIPPSHARMAQTPSGSVNVVRFQSHATRGAKKPNAKIELHPSVNTQTMPTEEPSQRLSTISQPLPLQTAKQHPTKLKQWQKWQAQISNLHPNYSRPNSKFKK